MPLVIPLWVIQVLGAIAILSYMLAEGLAVTVDQLSHLLHKRGLLARSIVAALVVVPACALLLVQWIPVTRATGIAILLMAISPAPPMGLQRSKRASIDHAYAVSLQVALCLIAIVSVPTTLFLLGEFYHKHVAVEPSAVARTVFVSQILPLLAGLMGRRMAPQWAERARPWLMKISRVGMPLVGILVLIDGGMRLLDIGWAGAGAVALLTVAALAAGFWLGGPVLALTAAARYPALAFLIALRDFPNQGVAYMIVAYTVVSIVTIMALHRVVTSPRWRKADSD